MNDIKQLVMVFAAAGGAALNPLMAMAQTDTLYVTNGDAARLAIVHEGEVSIATTHVRGYPIAVRDSIWIGDYNGNQPNSIEYDLAGNATGNFVPYTHVFAVDGATNGDTNYQLGNAFNSVSTVYSANADWSNSTRMFDVQGNDLVGITYDPKNDSLWISDSATIYEYGLDGSPRSQFNHNGGRGCLAYEPSTDTLWHVQNGTDTLRQYSKAGALLDTLTVPGLASNNWGAEFAGGGIAGPALTIAGSCPGSIALNVTRATPGGDVAFIYAFGTGNQAIPGGRPCAGTELGLDRTATLLGVEAADANGDASFRGNAPAAACGRVFVQAIDLDTCATTNVEGL